MAETAKNDAAEAAKMDLLEDDDEFEEFEVDQDIMAIATLIKNSICAGTFGEWDDKEDGDEAVQQWENDWDDDDVNDDFSLQLRKELESYSSKN